MSSQRPTRTKKIIILAVALVLAAYAMPIMHHLMLHRFGSIGFKPF